VASRSHRALLVACAVAVLLTWIVGALVGRQLVLRTIGNAEREGAAESALVGRDIIEHDGRELGRLVTDYASWEEACQFTRDRSDAFGDAYFGDAFLANFNVHVVLVFDSRGAPVWGRQVDPRRRAETFLAELRPEHFARRFPSLVPGRGGSAVEARKAGLLRTSRAPLLFATAPLTNTRGEGPRCGTLIFGRFVDEVAAEHWQAQTRLTLTVRPARPEAPLGPTPVELAGDHVRAGYVLPDFENKPVLEVSVVRRSEPLRRGENLSRTLNLMWFAIVLGGVGLLVTFIHARWMLPVERLGLLVSALEDPELARALPASTGHGPVAEIATAIRGLLKRLADRNRRLEEIAALDDLTEVLNRRAILDQLKRELSRARRYQLALSIAILDVDGFRFVNEARGPIMGDRVLREIARTLDTTARQADRVGRYGGAQFLVVLPHQNAKGARAAGERLRRAVEELEVDGVRVTLSGGLATLGAEGSTDQYGLEDLLLEADRHLRTAKTEGRNRVYGGVAA
jgi:diguanylate cyclase (GGDEF)-like protein